MEMRFEGALSLPAGRERVYGVVTDPKAVSACMPDVQKVDIRSADDFDAVVRAGVGFIKGDFVMHFRFVEKTPPSRAKMTAHGEGLGSAIDVEMLVELEAAGRGTSMKWVADATVSGRIASVGQRLMQSSAQKIITGFFGCFEDKLEGRQVTGRGP